MGLAVRIEFANVVTVQCLHDADARKHRRGRGERILAGAILELLKTPRHANCPIGSRWNRAAAQPVGSVDKPAGESAAGPTTARVGPIHASRNETGGRHEAGSFGYKWRDARPRCRRLDLLGQSGKHAPHAYCPRTKSRPRTETRLRAQPLHAERTLEHDPEKWTPVFRKDHAQTER
jgi:hypothetical protein